MDTATLDRCWFAIQVRPRFEFSVASTLHNKGYEEFVPFYRSARQWSDRTKIIATPMFTGYVFCRMNTASYGPIVTTPGVVRIVGTASGISPIEEKEIAAIQALMQSGLPMEPCPYLQVGDRVAICQGPMQGVEGILTGFKNKQRLVISIDLIQGSVAVDVEQHNLRKVGGMEKIAPRREAPATIAIATPDFSNMPAIAAAV